MVRIVEESETTVIRGREVEYEIKGGFYRWEWEHKATIIDLKTGLRGKSKGTESKKGALDRAINDLWAKLSISGYLDSTTSTATSTTSSTSSTSEVVPITDDDSLSKATPVIESSSLSKAIPVIESTFTSSTPLVTSTNISPANDLYNKEITIAVCTTFIATLILVYLYNCIKQDPHSTPTRVNKIRHKDNDDKLEQHHLGIDNLGHIMEDIESVATKFKQIGHSFKLKAADIERIEFSRHQRPWDALNDVVSEWLRGNFIRGTADGDDQPNRRWLINALTKIGEGQLAKDLEKKYMQQ